MEAFKIGTYQLGFQFCDVFADPKETGGCFYWMPEGQERSRIRIGFDYDDIETPFSILVHETMEFLIEIQGGRFRPTSGFVRSASDVYRFFFDHNQMTEIAAKLGCFLWDIRKDFEAAFELIQEEGNK